METVIRNIDEIDAHDLEALEHVLGHSLSENQQLVVRIVDRQIPSPAAQRPVRWETNGAPSLPEWCNVYQGLSDGEIAEMEKMILQRADLGRPFE